MNPAQKLTPIVAAVSVGVHHVRKENARASRAFAVDEMGKLVPRINPC